MDAISALAVCLLMVPVFMLAGWLVVEHHDRFTWTWHRRERRGFEVIMRNRGYSFTEVMFAVVVLGVGFIMVAAMFPVAMSQQQTTMQETNAASIARATMNYFETIATSENLPPTGTAAQLTRPMVLSIRDPQASTPAANLPAPPPGTPTLWDQLKGSLIVTGNNTYGVTVFYRRGGDLAQPNTWASTAQVITIVTQVRNRSTYKAGEDVYKTPTPAIYNLQGRPVTVKVTSDGANPVVDQVVIFSGPNRGAVAEGSYIVIADDNITGANEGVMNGYIYRIGAKRTAADEWDLAPGNDFKPFDPDGPAPMSAPPIEGLDDAGAFLIGRNATDTAGVFDGPAQDIAVYTSFIQIR